MGHLCTGIACCLVFSPKMGGSAGANGSVDRTRNFIFIKKYPKINAGAEIIVPKKPEKQRLSAQAWIAMATTIATLALVVQSLTK